MLPLCHLSNLVISAFVPYTDYMKIVKVDNQFHDRHTLPLKTLKSSYVYSLKNAYIYATLHLLKQTS